MVITDDSTFPVDAFLAKNPTLKALPENASRIIRMTGDANSNSAQLLKLIEQDAALAGQLMKVVNSSYYALPTKINRLDRAVAFMGLRTVKEITLSTCMSGMWSPANYGVVSARDLWDHCIGDAIVARELAVRSEAFDPEEAFLAGMMMDIGMLLVAQADPKGATQVLTRAAKSSEPFTQTEKQVYRFDHTELGHALAQKWGMNDAISIAMQFHHEPDKAPTEHKAFCNHLYIADTLCCQARMGCSFSAMPQKVEYTHLLESKITPEMTAEVVERLPILRRLHLG